MQGSSAAAVAAHLVLAGHPASMAWVFLLAAVALALMLLHKLLGTRTASPAGGRKATAASGWRRRTVVASAAGAVPRASYVPWEAAKDSAEDVLVVDCTVGAAGPLLGVCPAAISSGLMLCACCMHA